jgi:hypothetical protein
LSHGFREIFEVDTSGAAQVPDVASAANYIGGSYPPGPIGPPSFTGAL